MFFGCETYPDCQFVLWNRPVAKACPDCGRPYLVEKVSKRHGRQLVCDNDECKYTEDAAEAQVQQA